MSGLIGVLVSLAAAVAAWHLANRRQGSLAAWAAATGVASLLFLTMRIVGSIVGLQPVLGLGGPVRQNHMYVVNADGSACSKLTGWPAQYRDPDWSPDGGSILFASSGPQGSGIFVMNPDGTNRRELTDHTWSGGGAPTWSPDGSKIALIGYGPRGSDSIYVMNADGSDLTRLIQDAGIHRDPVWSPDSSRLAFGVFYQHRGSEIHVVNADGTGLVNATGGVGGGRSPSWSADGSRIAFMGWGRGFGVCTVNADGTDPISLASGVGMTELAWSPDGSRIAFSASTLGGEQVAVVNADGSSATTLPQRDYYDHLGGLAWSPDGEKIAFWGYPKDAWYPDLYVMNADGTGLLPVATIFVQDPAAKRTKIQPAGLLHNWRLLLPWNWGTLASSATSVRRSFMHPSGFSWSPDSRKIVFVSMPKPGAPTGPLDILFDLLAQVVFVLCAPAAVLLAVWSRRAEGRSPGATVGMLAGVIPTVVYLLFLILIIVTELTY